MEKIWLASTYYLDTKLAGCSASVERMFTRLLAYCGSAETGGKLPAKPWTFVGLPNGKCATFELVSRGVLVERSDGGFEFPAWSGWQQQGDDLAERRRRDRERKRRERAASDDASADMSAEFRAVDKRSEDKNRESTDKSSHVSNADEPEQRPSGPPIQRDAARLVRDIVPAEHPAAVKTSLRLKASELIHAGTAPDDVAEALRRWVDKTGVGPGILPSLVSDVVKERSGASARAAPGPRRSTTDDRIAAAQALKLVQPPTSFPRGELE